MQQIKFNEEDSVRVRVPFFLVSSTGTPVTGVTSPTLYASANGGAPFTPAGAWGEIGGGAYSLQLLQSEVQAVGFLAIRVSATGVMTRAQVVQIVAFDPYTVETNPNANVAVWGAAKTIVPDTVVDFPNVYTALGSLVFDATYNRWSAVWKDKTGPRPNSGITNPKITLHDRAGVLKVDSAAMTGIAGIGYKYDTTLKIPGGETWFAKFEADIDGATRMWRQPFAGPQVS